MGKLAAAVLAGVLASGSALAQGSIASALPPNYDRGGALPFSLDSRGGLRTTIINGWGAYPTFSAGAAQALAATATDVFTLCGSATKTVRVRQVTVQGYSTSGGGMAASLTLRSTADSGGTSAAITPVANSGGTVSASALAFSANPTVGASVGVLRSFALPMPTIAAAVNPQTFDFPGLRFDQGVTLSGTGSCLAVNFGGGAVPSGGTAIVNFEWTEE